MEAAVQHTVMEESFRPARRGRRPLVSVDPFLDVIMDAQPHWVLFEMEDAREANSILRQLGRHAGIETSSKRDGDGKKVYARWNPGG